MPSPTVSVLMPVYNGERHLRAALDSIITQTFADFELLVVDDGSTDNSGTILEEYARLDKRVIVVSNLRNTGISQVLNQGLLIARGKYVARMDADDISLPHRLQTQVDYLDKHPEVGILGTNVKYLDEHGFLIGSTRPKYIQIESPALIAWSLIWKCSILHPTVMFRRDLLIRTRMNYRREYEPTEDYDLWTRLKDQTIVDRLMDVTVHYRIVPTSISRSRRKEQQHAQSNIVRRQILSLMGDMVSETGINALICIFVFSKCEPTTDFQGASETLYAMYQRYLQYPLTKRDREQLQKDVINRQARIAYMASIFAKMESLSLFFRIRQIAVRGFISASVMKQALKIVGVLVVMRTRHKGIG